MAYFLFLKNLNNIEGTLCKIADNQSDLNNLNIIQSDYKIIQDSQENFNNVKLNIKHSLKYDGDIITFVDQNHYYGKKEELQIYLDSVKNHIKQFTDINHNHALFSRWNNYYSQLNNLNLDNINYPLTTSLEQYLNSLGQPFYNILQIP